MCIDATGLSCAVSISCTGPVGVRRDRPQRRKKPRSEECAMSEVSDTRPLSPEPAQIDIQVNGTRHSVTYEQAFLLAFSHVERESYENAAQLFEQLQQFSDRGPRAYIMQAFCEAAALHFD